MAPDRISTGIPGLDEIVDGGIPQHQSYLLLGSAGTGKTLTALQWLLHGEKQGDRCLFIALAEPFENMQRNVDSFGWDLSGLDYVDMNPVEEDGQAPEEYSVFPPSEVERTPMWQGIYDAIREKNPDRIVVDSLTQLRYLSADEYQFRKQLLALVTFLHRKKCTSILTYEPAELEDDTSVALAVDGIIHLRMEVSPQRLTGVRNVEVQKLRGSDFMSGYHSMRIADDGVHVYPHRIETPSGVEPGMHQLSSGIAGLDELIGGGLESGTVTILSGPCGAGKTTLGMQFVVEAARDGERGVVYTFEESANSILSRCASLGMDARELVEEGKIEVVRINPMELYPDEFLAMVRKMVEVEGYEVVMIDSLRGYELAMAEYGSVHANLHNLVTYLNGQSVTTIFTNELEQITGDLTATELGVSNVADTLLLLRYAEYMGQVTKVIACLKKRHSAMKSDLRRFEITSDGLRVGEEMTALSGVLTGAPHTVDSDAAPGPASDFST